MKKDRFMELLKEAGINKKEFAKIAHTSYGTVNGWGADRKGVILEIPNWVEPFILHYMKSRELDYLMGEVCQKYYDKDRA